MKKLTFWKSLFLLCALIVGSTSAWADEEPVVTADFTTAAVGNSNYTNTWTYGDWSLTNCANNNKGWAYIRCGGKGGSSATSTTTSTTTIQGTKKIDYDIKEVKVYHNGTSNNDFTVNSVVLEVSSVSDFSSISNEIELTPTITKQVAGTVSFTTGAPYASGSYYRVTINWTVKGTKNYGLDVTKVEFYEDAAAKTATTTEISIASLTNTDLKNGTAAGTLTASVTVTEGGAAVSGATVKWSSDDEGVATVDENTGVVTLAGVGTATITASYEGDDTYAESSDTYELTVTDTRTATVTTIDDAGITNIDLKNGTAAGTLTASVTAGGDPVLGATVTWESSDPTVATITDGGVVTLAKVGSTTITASYAGGGSYAASSGTYVLNVVDSEQKNPVTIQMTNSLFGQDVHNSGKSTEELTFIGYQDNVKVTYYVPDDSYYYFNTSNTRPYNTCTLTYGAPAGYVITEIDFTSDGTNWHDATPSVGEMTATKTWEGFDQEVTFSWETSGTRVKTVVVTLAEVVTLTPAKTYTTLTSAYALDFTNVSGLEAFIAKDGVSEGSVKMTQVNKVPAGTGLVLKATTPNSAVNIPVFDGTGADDVSGNLMVGSATETTAIEKDGGYILSNGVFQPANAGTLAAGKAYLQIAVTSARSLEMSFDDATTAINGIEEVAPVNVKTRKVVKNGRLVIETANGEFTIDGARMK